jgi:hypothetical protein
VRCIGFIIQPDEGEVAPGVFGDVASGLVSGCSLVCWSIA